MTIKEQKAEIPTIKVFRAEDCPSSCEAELRLMEYMKQNPSLVLNRAIIHYNPDKGLPDMKDETNYPLCLVGQNSETQEKMKLYVYALTAGDTSASSMTMMEILNTLGFQTKEIEILSPRAIGCNGWINITYEK